LAAPGDTGKSTCCRRLPAGWTAWGDDEILVVLDPQGTYQAHPFPTWSEYLEQRSEQTWPVQHSVPLAAVFFLEQAPTDEALPVGQGHAAFLMTESAAQVGRKFWSKLDPEFERDFRRALFDNASRLAQRVPAFRLRCRREGRFWEEIERVWVAP
jgi:SynChlorMet cassette protein ScmC